MPKQLWSGAASRQIVKRIVMEGDLQLQTPAHFGNGDGDEITDMPLLVDPRDERTPLLTGASIAGAMRSYLRSRLNGYRGAVDAKSASVLLFGGLKGDDKGEQSPLIVEDAYGKDFGVELREGVRIEPSSRTAKEDYLYDARLWQAGTAFTLRFELVIRQDDSDVELKKALRTALTGFIDGGITLGARKRRGYGQVSVTQWRLREFNLTEPAQLIEWLSEGAQDLSDKHRIDGLSTLSASEHNDQRSEFHLHGKLALDGSLLIRSGGGKDDRGPDMVHLRVVRVDGPRNDRGEAIPLPILSGTSLAGALRARALKIANTIAPTNASRAKQLVDEMWGADMEELRKRRQGGDQDARPYASRVLVEEHVVKNTRHDLVQSRVSIDRFTGGARDGALFNEQPIFGGKANGNDTTVEIDIRLIEPKEHEIGLLLLLLKDLWTGDLPLGGESSVGRGRLAGRSATMTWRNGAQLVGEWELVNPTLDKPDKLDAVMINGDDDGAKRQQLQGYVNQLWQWLTGGDA